MAVACWTYDSRSVPPLEHFVNYLQVVDVVTTTKARVTSNGVSHVPLSHSLSSVISSGVLKQKKGRTYPHHSCCRSPNYPSHAAETNQLGCQPQGTGACQENRSHEWTSGNWAPGCMRPPLGKCGLGLQRPADTCRVLSLALSDLLRAVANAH